MAAEETPVVRVRGVPELAAVPTTAPAPAAMTPVAAAQGTPIATIGVNASGQVTYVAREGDTVSELASALLGSGSKEHRDAVVAANSSLQDNPDYVLAGQTYSINVAAPQAEGDPGRRHQSASDVANANSAAIALSIKGTSRDEVAVSATDPKLKYMAQLGDTVRVLAAHLLGGDTKANRDAIIAGNPSLREDPNEMVAGKSYTIAARNGLAADPAARQPASATNPRDADDIVRNGAGRSLRYTARAGDTVSSLAAALLGSDTPANRDSIIKNNPTLKQDPDHLVAGKTYWITAPTTDSAR
jgi:hypothetical protein